MGKYFSWFVILVGLVLTVGCADSEPVVSDPQSVAPVSSYLLSNVIEETSGLMLWDGLLWTHNESRDTRLFGLDVANGKVVRTISLPGVNNIDWESLTHHGAYIYVGDFGNNSSGNRDDLHILRVEKASLLSGLVVIDTIWFSYSNQSDLESREPESTDFDCEAFVASGDSLYLFTKQWLSNASSCYVLPNVPGRYSAQLRETVDVDGLVTGATWLEEKNMLMLCGYTSLLLPFFYLFTEIGGDNFFDGEHQRINISMPFHQVEGVATDDGRYFYVTNELYELSAEFRSSQKLHLFDLGNLTKQ